MAKTQKKKLTKQQKQLYALGGLLGLLVLAVLYNVVGSSKRPAPPPKTAGEQSAKPAANGAASDRDIASSRSVFGPIEVLPIDYVPAGGDVSPLRNVFDYPPPPPKVPPPQQPKVTPPPPTINLGSVNPGQAIAGTSKSIAVTLSGSLFPSDAQVFAGGQLVQSQRVSSTQIRATLPPAALATPGGVALTVRSASQPEKLKSGAVNFTLTPSPDPSETFAYSGRVGGQAVLTFKDAAKRPKLVSVGETVNGSVPWKVVSINDRQIELLDTRNEIKKSLGLVAKSK